MSAEASKTVAPKKTAKKTAKKVAKKAPAAKTAKKGGQDRGPSKTQIAVLQKLKKSSKAMTRSQLSEALDGAFVGADMMGHFEPKKLKPKSLVARGLVKFAPSEDEDVRAAYYTLSAAGKKFLESLK